MPQWVANGKMVTEVVRHDCGVFAVRCFCAKCTRKKMIKINEKCKSSR